MSAEDTPEGQDKQPSPTEDLTGPISFHVIGLGASAGGLEAIQAVLAKLPDEFAGCIVITQHLAKSHASHLSEILARSTKLPLVAATRGERIRPGRVYVLPAEGDAGIGPDGVVVVRPSATGGRPQRIDFLFTTLATSCGERAVAVVLSGTGSDGTHGALAVKRAGGTVIAESEESARYFGMPNAAIATGAVDFVKAAGDIGLLLSEIVRGEAVTKDRFGAEDLKAILESLRRRRGTTFDQYRPPTLRRRIHKRMLALGAKTLAEYRQQIDQDPTELDHLFDTLLINVTEFFRDPAAWDAFAKAVLPDIISRRRRGQEIRVWCAGCASGEEAYTLAILLAEAMDDPSDWENIKIFATDIDEDALATARSGRYDPSKLQNVTPERFNRFFLKTGPTYEIIKPVRRMVIFGLHDLTKDPPIGRLDVLLCRNVLIYFDLPLQRRLAMLFRYSLREGGSLFLGRSEAIPRDVEGFEAVDRTWRIYTNKGVHRPAPIAAPAPLADARAGALSDQRAIEAAMRESAVASPYLAAVSQYLLAGADIILMILDQSFGITFANQYADQVLAGAGSTLRGKNLIEVLENLKVNDIRGIEQARQSRRHARVETVQVAIQNRKIYLDLTIEPFTDPEGQLGSILVGQDVTAREETREALRDRARELQETVEELQTTNEELQSANEELVTANEELQSANEELATLNEEFQSTNEELETTNEELQSTNTELAAVNQELQRSADDLEDLNRVLAGVGAVSRALVVCDASESIVQWTERAKEFFGHHRDDVIGRNVYSVDLGVDAQLLRNVMSKAKDAPGLVTSEPIDVGEGKRRRAVITAQKVRDDAGKIAAWVIAFHDVSRLDAVESDLRDSVASNGAHLGLVKEGVAILDDEGRVQQASTLAEAILKASRVSRGDPIWNIAVDRAHVLELKGAVVEMTRRDAAVVAPHKLNVKLQDGSTAQLELMPVSAHGAPPLVILRRMPG